MEEWAEKLLEDYKVIIDISIAWGDMDAFQHVNNVVYFRYLENARVEYGNRIEIIDRMETEGLGPILAWTDCKYIRPVAFPDTLLIGVRAGSIEGTEMKMEYTMVSKEQREVIATGNSLSVFYDYRNRQRTDFPDELVAKVEKLEGRTFIPDSK